jgi:alpha-L-fucosidase
MNDMVFQLQPEIIVNNRNGLEGDFSTPEQHIEASKAGRAWETCMTLNESWGYQKADDEWKTPKTIVKNLATCSGGGGNYLLNIGPKPDGSIPEESVRILETVGQWLDHNGPAIYGTGRGDFRGGTFTNYTRRGNTLYIHVFNWPGNTPVQQWLTFYQPPSVIAIGGFKTKIRSAKMLKSGVPVKFEQDEFSARFTGLPAAAPDTPVSVIEVECESDPTINHESIRALWPRYGVGVRGQG